MTSKTFNSSKITEDLPLEPTESAEPVVTVEEPAVTGPMTIDPETGFLIPRVDPGAAANG